MLQGEPSWSSERLWQEIKQEAVRGANDGNLNFLMPAFTALLVKLSAEADRRARTIVNLTWGLLALTVALLVLTAFQIWKDWSAKETLPRNSVPQACYSTVVPCVR
jgi:hypothetical protein